eukprot:1361281-Pyramimonas_sp.AAC.1
MNVSFPRGKRVVARCQPQRRKLRRDSGGSGRENHRTGEESLARRSGDLRDDPGACFGHPWACPRPLGGVRRPRERVRE